MTNEPIPDELCHHVEMGAAEMTGGVFFAAHEPPIAVGMCHECVVWCNSWIDHPATWDEWNAIGRPIEHDPR